MSILNIIKFIRDGIPYLNEGQKSQLKKDLTEGILLRATERRIQNEDEDGLKQGKTKVKITSLLLSFGG